MNQCFFYASERHKQIIHFSLQTKSTFHLADVVFLSCMSRQWPHEIVSHLSCLTLRPRWGNLATVSSPSSCTVSKPGQTTRGGRLQPGFFKAALFILECFTQSFFFTCLLCCQCRTKKPFIILKHKKSPSSLSPPSCSLPAWRSVRLKQSGYFWKLN